jgi:hypothetical protein
MKTLFSRLARWLTRKTASAPLAAAATGPLALDAYNRHRVPTSGELLAELKNTAWTCATINAAMCASCPPRLYVTTARGQAPPRCRTRALAPAALNRLQGDPQLAPYKPDSASLAAPAKSRPRPPNSIPNHGSDESKEGDKDEKQLCFNVTDLPVV